MLKKSKTRQTAKVKKNPPLSVVLAILNKYRKKSSFFFFLRWGLFLKPQPNFQKHLVPAFLNLVDQWNQDHHQLWSLYYGLSLEIGEIKASLAILDIIAAAKKASLEK